MERLLLTALLLGGCTCSHDAPTPPSVPAEAPRPARIDAWPAAVIDLESRPRATRVTVLPTTVEIDNRALVATWPAAALERARAAPDSRGGDWPRLTETVALTDDAALLTALQVARRAERAATGSGGGAGLCDLRVGSDVAFEDFERVLRATGLAGYGSPRVLLGEEDALVVFAWPRAASAGGPSQAEIVEALAAVERGEEPSLADPGASDARLRLSDAGARVWLGGERRCEDLTDATVETCLRGLVATRVTVEVAGELTFGEVVPWVQRASRATESLGVRSVR